MNAASAPIPPVVQARPPASIARRIVDALGSMRLAVWTMLFFGILTWAGTLAQKDLGLYVVQRDFFESFFVRWDTGVEVADKFVLKIPLPGGYLLMLVMFVNLVVGGMLRVRWSARNIGILITQRRFDDANARIDEIAKRDPKNVLPYQLRGEVALARGDVPAAESAYRKMVEFAPTVPAGYLGLARIKTQRNAIDDAIAALQEGERAIPDNNSLTAARAELLSRAGRTDDSIAAYETLVKRAPDDEVFANNLAYQLIESKGDKASLERALALTTRFKSSSNPGYLDTLGWAHYKLGQYAEAAPVLERSVQLAPDAPLLQLHLGMALYKSGNTVKGQELVNKALGSNAKLPGADEARKLISQG